MAEPRESLKRLSRLPKVPKVKDVQDHEAPADPAAALAPGQAHTIAMSVKFRGSFVCLNMSLVSLE